MIKKSKTDGHEAADSSQTTFRDNAQINQKIDDYIQKNPKHWQYIQAMPRQRMERAMVLHEVQKNERQQKLENGILRKLERDPELKKTYENLVKDLPEDQREKAMVSIASRTMRDIAARQSRKERTQGAVTV
ncbi:hypothetical protein FEM03_07255 [Phragmitibacter flavus]|uniref:Uncharacterized protein n=1 Tax=Phragmitibacter flavus TaxID=2576071 RepID=A0A5R8KGA8_9BACT|nr:hypothetical protein [Phragmitibacter flavus]TLD71320.1 hypothetical protein FEM03_07255 [Phragmitibacter flavus]